LLLQLLGHGVQLSRIAAGKIFGSRQTQAKKFLQDCDATNLQTTCFADFFAFPPTFLMSLQSRMQNPRDFVALEFQANVIEHHLFALFEIISRTPAASEISASGNTR